jgi:hypothetical protein
MSKRWCPVCEDAAEGKLCLADSIPSVDPLAVPEPTTWGESGGAEAVCLSAYFDDAVFIRDNAFAWVDSMGWRVSDGVWQDWRDVPDIVDAINYVAGVRK